MFTLFRRTTAGACWHLASTAITLAVFTVLIPTAPANAGSITQYFPAAPPGQAAPERESGWRISWTVREPGSHSYGSAAVWEFTNIEFMRGKRADGSENWIRILNRLAMAEMYVPYPWVAYEDIQHDRYPMLPAKRSYLPRNGVIRARIEPEPRGVSRTIISEVVDDGIRWVDNKPHESTSNRDYPMRRGQVLKLWGTLAAANYSYTILYIFSDDGRISVRVGGTAQNLANLPLGDLKRSINDASHAHMGAWRMEFDLGDASANRMEIVERKPGNDPSTASVETRLFAGGREGGERWNPERFTVVKVVNETSRNSHNPPQPVSYVLKTRMFGQLRTDKSYTRNDFWLSRLRPATGRTRENRFNEVANYVGDRANLAGERTVLWHSGSLFHIPRGEDFGKIGYVTYDGAAINTYTGFDLVPVNLWHKTPFIPDRTIGTIDDRGPADPRYVDNGNNDPDPDPDPNPDPDPDLTPITRTLRTGSQGPQVRTLQILLNRQGNSLTVDGDFGGGTRRAVQAFQRANGLTADGVVGPATRRALQSSQ